MAEHYRTRGIILRKQDVGESDRSFTIFTEDFGKIRVMAISERRISSKLRKGLDTLFKSNIEFVLGKNRTIVTDADPIALYPLMRRDLIRMQYGFMIAKTTDLMLNGEERDSVVWDLLNRSYNAIDSVDVSPLAVYQYFFWNFVSHMGYAPESSKYPVSIRTYLDEVLIGNMPETAPDERFERELVSASDKHWDHIFDTGSLHQTTT